MVVQPINLEEFSYAIIIGRAYIFERMLVEYLRIYSKVWGQFSSDHIPFVSIPWFFRPSTLFKWHFVVFHHYFLMTSTLALKFLPISFAGNIPPFSTEIGHFRAKCFSFEKQCFNENFTYVFNKVSSISRDLLSVLSMNVL